ncbi:23S rRNA (uracil(1939)-C(5))-methyltransferase RlmD [Peloplasma aerotolerans]|uniref:23S rRNA (Uracil(1939)-C(5))-methyltransferase RlmD n=1 Tax=Peloplasma aerotolerans TaxID=3044389 RepID=A0AAW6U8Q7_9MOLU|nr:23S rRNA (uracil(1939)-C(5))-methyltransferase RlmD [Mariniplasma sp. M4Ah]MDI6453110.1 23S rRNA (uracil(1939)-C(5))-methyltransferase RlmD [Mariniplasma sp. M4Ah]
MNQEIKVDDQIVLNIKRMGINGEGIGYLNKLAIFVDYALPDEDIEVVITEVYENRAVGKIKNILKPSSMRREPFCPVYESCGGCQTQHLDYEETLVQKRDILIKSFERYAGRKIDEDLIKKTMGADQPRYYRNKASLPVQKFKMNNKLGMYARNSSHFVIIEDCPVQNQLINQILKTIIQLMDELGVDALNAKTRRGYVRSLVVRVSENHKEAQVSFIMMNKSNRLPSLVERLVEKEKNIVSVFEVLNPDIKKPGYFTDDVKLLYGKETITETLNNQTYLLKPEAFFQLNTPQAHKFYLEMKRLASLKPHEIAIDAYAGIAPISHYIHKDAKHVYAIELDSAACESAKLSLKQNHITNVTVLQSDFKRALSGLKEKKIDVMFFDPPRVGLGKESIDLILEFKPKRIIYGSCNPSTLAKDFKDLLNSYHLVEVVPIDMFPYTSLVESVSLLVLKTS